MNQATTTGTLDPVCGMTIDPTEAAGTSRYEGTDYFFCARSCKAKFDATPAKYVAAEPAGAACCSTCQH